jgi:hypothetical protein
VDNEDRKEINHRGSQENAGWGRIMEIAKRLSRSRINARWGVDFESRKEAVDISRLMGTCMHCLSIASAEQNNQTGKSFNLSG